MALAEQERAELKEQIAAINAQHEQALDELGTLEQQLAEAERQVSDAVRKLAEMDEALAEQTKNLAELQQQHTQIQQTLAQERSVLAEQIRAAYMIGRHERLHLLLNQQDPSSLGRALAYHQYLAQARADIMRDIIQHQTELEQAAEKIKVQEQQLRQTRNFRTAELKELEAAQQARQHNHLALQQAITQMGAELKSLKQDQARLDELIVSLQRVIAGFDLPDAQQVEFSARKGELPWPVRASQSIAFGSSRSSQLNWDGIVLAAPEGTKVAAVHGGRVAYADWLRGFGLMVILDHGSGFMTLYGYNQSLYKEVGDWVEAGDTIALVGQEQEAPGLYFAIRQHGKAKDPGQWCRSGSPNQN